jgi:hypothetical protein
MKSGAVRYLVGIFMFWIMLTKAYPSIHLNQADLDVHFIYMNDQSTDTIPPQIFLNTPDTVKHLVNKPYTPVAVTASDNETTEAGIQIKRTSNVNPFKLGLYQDVYTAADSANNSSTRSRWVRVFDSIPPVIQGLNGNILRVDTGVEFNPIDYLKFSDNYDNPTTLKKNARVLFDDINTHLLGTYSVIVITNDQSGNLSDTFRLIVIVDTWGGVWDEEQQKHFKLFPNPSNCKVRIQFNESVIGIYSSFYLNDVWGHSCKSFDLSDRSYHEITLDLTDLRAGVYLLMGVTNDGFSAMLSRLVHY